MSNYPMWPNVNMPGVSASLQPPDSQLAVDPTVRWMRLPLSEPAPWIPYNDQNTIGTFTRIYAVNVTSPTDVAAGTEAIKTIQVDIPGAVCELMGSARTTDGSDFPVGASPRDMFLVRFDHSQGDKLTTQAAIGTAVVGTAERPKKVIGNGWKFGRGSTILLGITPLVTNLRVDITITYVEFRAGANFGQLG